MLKYILMANSINFKETDYKVGDTITINYIIKEGDKERQQLFKGILLKIKGDSDANRMITVRKISKVGIGVERIIPLASPFIGSIKLDKKSNYRKAKLLFIRDLSESQVRNKLYRQK
jgi:large subunit ribosomal protein L19